MSIKIHLVLEGSSCGIVTKELHFDIIVNELECQLSYYIHFGGARGVMVIVVGNGHGDTSSNPGRD